MSLIFISILLTACKKNIQLLDYTSVNFTGLDGYGNVKVDIDAKTLIADILKAEGKNDIMDNLVAAFGIEDVDFEITPKSTNLKNGDEIKVKVFPVQEVEHNKYKLISGEKTFKVNGLEKGTEIDLFKDIVVSFSEVSPSAKIQIINNSTDDFLRNVNYFTENGEMFFKKGDTVKITAMYDKQNAINNKYIVTSDVKSYTVDNVDEYVSVVSQIDDETIEKIKKENQDIIDAYISKNFNSILYLADAKMNIMSDKENRENLNLATNLLSINLLSAKDPTIWGDKNKLLSIYEISFSNKLNPSPLTIYFAIEYSDLIKRNDTSIDIKYSDYEKTLMKRLDDMQREVLTGN